MKNIFKSFLAIATLSLAVSCSDDTEIPPFKPLIFSEDFPEAEINYNATFDFEGWTNFAETGTKLWIERDFNNDGYIQFSSFGSGQASNIGWAITPAINMDENIGEVLTFQSATNFVDNPDNKLEVFISSDMEIDPQTIFYAGRNIRYEKDTADAVSYIKNNNRKKAVFIKVESRGNGAYAAVEQHLSL